MPIIVLPRKSGSAKVVVPLPPNCVPKSANNAWFWLIGTTLPSAGKYPLGQKLKLNVQTWPRNGSTPHAAAGSEARASVAASKFFTMDLLIDLNEMEQDAPHRPGKLYKFNFEKYEKKNKKWVGIDF